MKWCRWHYARWRRYGDAGEKPIKPMRKKGTGWIDHQGYHSVGKGGRHCKAHRLLMEKRLGRPLLPEETVHHKNGVRLDNRDDNLELWSSRQPAGQRVEDKLAWAREFIELYDPTPEWIGGGC